MIKIFGTAVLFFILFIVMRSRVYAESNYVLPYPSSMPGSFAYKLHLIYENLSRYWYFGDFGQFDYNLKMANKYLVEAKTLFEYKQYLLADRALKKSDYYFAQKKNKNITQKQNLLKEAASKHIEVLIKIKSEIPKTFIWRPEKSLPTVLNLKKSIEESIATRNKAI